MKKIIRHIFGAAFATLLLAPLSATAQEPLTMQIFEADDITSSGASLSDITMERQGDLMVVNMDLNFSDTKMKGDRAILYAPVIINGNNSAMLEAVGLYGRTRWIQYQRAGEKPILTQNEIAYQFSKRPNSLKYSSSVPYEDWMNGAALALARYDYGCCRHLIESKETELATWREIVFQPSFDYVTPQAVIGPKERDLEGEAFIDFPVDQTIIYPDYRRNATELDSIRRTIDVVRLDPDATIQTVWLKGFASPESPYAHNSDLAKGRTEALKNYIKKLYNFNGVEILTDYEPEDWDGLRKAVVASNLEHKNEILEIIDDTTLEPDPKEWRIKLRYPDEYKFMLDNYYPALRHTTYKVHYTVRNYTDPAEILELIKTRPGNLDLNEYYIAASSLTPGSEEYNELFETAARNFPDVPVANLNAANAAMQRGDLISAKKYLNKAGDSAEAMYARSVYNTMTGNYAQARADLNEARAKGYTGNVKEVEQLDELLNYHSRQQ